MTVNANCSKRLSEPAQAVVLPMGHPDSSLLHHTMTHDVLVFIFFMEQVQNMPVLEDSYTFMKVVKGVAACGTIFHAFCWHRKRTWTKYVPYLQNLKIEADWLSGGNIPKDLCIHQPSGCYQQTLWKVYLLLAFV